MSEALRTWPAMRTHKSPPADLIPDDEELAVVLGVELAVGADMPCPYERKKPADLLAWETCALVDVRRNRGISCRGAWRSTRMRP